MPRIVKTHAIRREEILDCAQRLIISGGYEPMTIQVVLDELRIAKGTFYHYFDSKQALLEAVVDRLIGGMERLLRAVLDDPRLSAAQALNQFFAAFGRFKTAQQPLMLSLLRVWYADENAVVRHKMRAVTLERIAPLLAEVVRHGVDSGEFSPRHPDETAEVVLALSQDLTDALSRAILAPNAHADLSATIASTQRTLVAYTEAVERALGVPAGTLVLADRATLEASVSYLSSKLKEVAR